MAHQTTLPYKQSRHTNFINGPAQKLIWFDNIALIHLPSRLHRLGRTPHCHAWPAVLPINGKTKPHKSPNKLKWPISHIEPIEPISWGRCQRKISAGLLCPSNSMRQSWLLTVCRGRCQNIRIWSSNGNAGTREKAQGKLQHKNGIYGQARGS